MISPTVFLQRRQLSFVDVVFAAFDLEYTFAPRFDRLLVRSLTTRYGAFFTRLFFLSPMLRALDLLSFPQEAISPRFGFFRSGGKG